MSALSLTAHFVRREVRNRYLGSISGGAWALLQPLIQLGVYGFVFVYVFHSPVPGANAPGFVPFLVMGLWPWNAFAEAVTRSTTAIQDNAALIGKVALPRELLVLSTVVASFLIQILGFCAICVALRLFGIPIHLVALPVALLGYAQLFVFALGCGLMLAALQVFVRDLAPALPQMLMLWMFASPVFYERSALPERYQGWLDWNPFTYYPEFFRSILLQSGAQTMVAHVVSFLVAMLVLAMGLAVFRRLEPFFEDFL
jgi:lipopolysaccharide transport system permease protein